MVDKLKAIELREQGLTYKDIANQLDCSVIWCKQNLKMTTKGTIVNSQAVSTLSSITATEMGRLDYNSVKWSEHFYLDTESPTGLRWLHQEHPYRHKGDVAGHPQKTSKGKRWVVHFNNSLWVVSRIICTMAYGAFDPLLVIDHLDGNPSNNNTSNLAIKTVRGNAQNTVMPDSGLPRGITFLSSKGYLYYMVTWYELSGKKRNKCFSCRKLGEEKALASAIAFRLFCIETLNKEGMQYTTRHS